MTQNKIILPYFGWQKRTDFIGPLGKSCHLNFTDGKKEENEKW